MASLSGANHEREAATARQFVELGRSDEARWSVGALFSSDREHRLVNLSPDPRFTTNIWTRNRQCFDRQCLGDEPKHRRRINQAVGHVDADE